MQSEYIKTEIDGFIGTLMICRPKALNALNGEVIKEIEFEVESLKKQRLRCLVIRGSGGKAFVAGADIAEMEKLTKAEALEFSRSGNKAFEAIHKLPFPTIAVINGYALGGGCELALSCDIRLCTKKSIFGQPETSLGIIPGFGGTQRLSRIVGIAKAKELIFTGRMIKAEEAYRIGLVNDIYDEDIILEKAYDLANQIANNAPIAIRAAKQCLDSGIEMVLSEGISIEERMFAQTFQSDDQREGMRAFLEKREHNPYVDS